MSELQLITNRTTTDKIELQTFDLPQNYSILINKLEQLALGLDSAFGNLSVNRKEVELAVGDVPEEFLGAPIPAGRAPPPRAIHSHGMDEVEYTHVVSDIWIGVILTLLIVSVIFFICSCFLYHKFQQWKNSYRTNPNEPVEICRHYGADFESESLPSYTIVSGLPTYDDALEEFRKAGIILAPPMPVVKIFEKDSKENQIYNLENGLNPGDGDNISINSTCNCGATANSTQTTATPHNSTTNLQFAANNVLNGFAGTASAGFLPPAQVIELSPEQLAALSQKRLSLQITFNNSVRQRRSSRPRIDLYRQVNRNNLLRSRALRECTNADAFPQIHRASSSLSLSNDQNLLDHRLQHLHHRGSLC